MRTKFRGSKRTKSRAELRQRSKILGLCRERSALKELLRKERVEAHNIMKHLDASQAEVRGLRGAQIEWSRLKDAFSIISTKSNARERGLKGALEMLRKSVDFYVMDNEDRQDYVVLSKVSVADFLLELARIEDS